jgi:CheY-like chemotaxis protein
MQLWRSLLFKLGILNLKAERSPISIFLLDDDPVRHKWFKKRFEKDHLDIAQTVEEAKKLLLENNYDAIFLDHDLLPHHYGSNDHNDYENTGYSIAKFLSQNPELQKAATIIVHTRNADAAIPMVQELRQSGRNAEYAPFPMLDFKIKKYWER